MVVCGWCRKIIRSTPELDDISHGMCEECRDWMIENKPGRSLKQFLDSLQAPVVIVNHEMEIQTGNAAASQILNKELERFSGNLCGDALDCAHARLPGGCGKTVCCQTCTIRKSVRLTYETGVPCEYVESFQNVIINGNERRIRILISTWKSEELVYLRIDELGPV